MSEENVKREKFFNIIIFIIFFIKIQLYFCQKCNNIYNLENSECFNNILIINNSRFRSGQFAKNKEGDIFIEYSNGNKRLYYGLLKNGSYYYNNELHCKEKIIEGISYNDYLYVKRYESKNLFISTKNDISKTKEYLLSLGSYKTLIEIYDIDNDIMTTHITENVLNDGIFSFHFPLFGKMEENQNTYITIYTHDNGTNIYHEGYLFSIKKFSFVEDNEGNINVELIQSSEKYDVRDSRLISGFLGDNDFIYAVYLTKENIIYIQKHDYKNLEYKERNIVTEDLFDKYDMELFKTGVFRSIYIKNNLASLIYFKSESTVKFFMLNLEPNYFSYLWTDLNLNIFPQSQALNDYLKISEERLLFMTSNYDKIHFLFIDLYNNYTNIKVRYHSYFSTDYYFDQELSGFNYNDYLIFTITAVDKKLDYDNYTFFLMIFGYANGTDDEIDIKPYLSDIKSFDINNNLVKKLIANINIENNIFGYEAVNKIKLINIPKEIKLYNLEQPDKELDIGETLDINHKLIQNNNLIKTNIFYYLEYQFIIKEPEYSTFYNNAQQTFGDTEDLSRYYNPKIFYGRINKLKFKLCHKYCNTCELYGTSDDDQKCLSCLSEYQYDYFNSTKNNCVPEGYFYNNNTNKLVKCNKVKFTFIKNEILNKTFCFPNEEITDDETKFSIVTTDIIETVDIKETEIINIENCSYIGFIEDLCKNINYTNKEILNILIPNLIETYPKSNGINIIIKGQEDILFHLTTDKNEKNKINDYSINVEKLSVLDLKGCEDILKTKNDIDKNDSLIIFKVEKISNNIQEKEIQYEIYHPYNKIKLDLSICDSIDLNIPVVLTEERLDLYNDLQKLGYDILDINDPFYKDICSNYKTKNGTDILLSDRQNDIYDNELTCQNNCEYSSYSEKTKYLKCECKINNKNITLEKFKEIMYEGFTAVLKSTNYKFIKCYKLVFCTKSITTNYGSIILIILFLINLCILIIYIIKGIQPLKLEIIKMTDNIKNKNRISEIKKTNITKKANTKIKIKKKNLKISNPPKKLDKSSPTFINLCFQKKEINKSNSSYIYNKNKNINNNKKNNNNNSSRKSSKKSLAELNTNNKLNQLNTEINSSDNFNILDDYELNNLSYEEALKLDKRTFIQIYCSMLRKKHLIMFAFCTPNDFNLSYIKFSKFIFLIATNFAMNVLFFFDESMHKIYINSGGFNLIQQIPQIIYSSLVSIFFEFVISFLVLSEGDIHDVKNNKIIKKEGYMIKIYETLKCIKIKFIIYFIFSFSFLIFYWYFVATFCAVYENTQVIFIEDTLTSFALNLFYPLFKYIFFTLCRIISLRCNKNSKSCNFFYKLGVF